MLWRRGCFWKEGAGIHFQNGEGASPETMTIPVIGASIWNYDDIEKLFGFGAKAVAFGSVFMCYPWRPTRYLLRWSKRIPK